MCVYPGDRALDRDRARARARDRNRDRDRERDRGFYKHSLEFL